MRKPFREWSPESKTELGQAVAAMLQATVESLAVTSAMIVKLAQRTEERR
jgi:hypothetical protein